MDYNTQRKRLILPEYGRKIHKMVDHITTIEDREERNKAARTIISIMGSLNPHLRDIADFKHKLWDHLALMSDFNLDIEWPYELPERSEFEEKPKQVPYNTFPIKYKHYGKCLELMVKEAIKIEDKEEKHALIKLIANHMKKSFLMWNRNTVSDEDILNDLNELSEGKLSIPEDLRLFDTKEFLNKAKKKRQQKKK